MSKDLQIRRQSAMKRLILCATVISGFAAAYLMYRRGESLISIATEAAINPIGSLVFEVANVI